jgi:hypothetical protein
MSNLLAIDIGNGNTKAVLNGGQPFSMPSYVLPVHGPIDKPDEGYVEYVRGDRPDLAGQSWLAGLAAYEQDPTGYDSVNSDDLGKLDKALQMLLGVLSYQLPRAADIQLVCSIHLIQLAPEVTKRLHGRHVVRYNAYAQEVTVNVAVLKVAPEGFGAVLEHGLTAGKNIVLDLGNGTLITTVYGNKARVVDRDVQPGGFEDLVSRLCADSELVAQLGQQGNPDRIRRAFESGSYRYANTGIDLRPIITRHMQPWAIAKIAKGLAFARKHQADATKAIAIGGGLMLAPVANIFLAKGITPAQDPVFCNARGLYRLAQKLSS